MAEDKMALQQRVAENYKQLEESSTTDSGTPLKTYPALVIAQHTAFQTKDCMERQEKLLSETRHLSAEMKNTLGKMHCHSRAMILMTVAIIALAGIQIILALRLERVFREICGP